MSKYFSLGLIGFLLVTSAPVFAECHGVSSLKPGTGYRFCKKAGSTIKEYVVASTGEVQGLTRSGTTLKTGTGTKVFEWGSSDSGSFIVVGIKMKIPSAIKTGPRTANVTWPTASYKVDCGIAAKFELLAVMNEYTWELESYKYDDGGPWKYTGQNLKRMEFKTSSARPKKTRNVQTSSC